MTEKECYFCESFELAFCCIFDLNADEISEERAFVVCEKHYQEFGSIGRKLDDTATEKLK